jgi:hypothetical protein
MHSGRKPPQQTLVTFIKSCSLHGRRNASRSFLIRLTVLVMEASEIEIDGFLFRRRSKLNELGPSSSKRAPMDPPALGHATNQTPPGVRSPTLKWTSDHLEQKVLGPKVAIDAPGQNNKHEHRPKRSPKAAPAKLDKKKRKSRKRSVAHRPQKIHAFVEDILRAEYEKASLSGASVQELKEIEQGIVDVVSAASNIEERSKLSQQQYETLVKRESYLLAMAQELSTDLRAWENIKADECRPKSEIALPSSPCLSGKSALRELEAVPVISPRGAERLTLSTYYINDALKTLEAQNSDNSIIIAAVTRELLS